MRAHTMNSYNWRAQAVLVLLVTGCSAGSTERTESTDEGPAPAVRVRDGLRFTPLYKNHSEKFVFKRPTAPDGREVDRAPARAPETLSDAELADRMTGITQIDGWVYRVEP